MRAAIAVLLLIGITRPLQAEDGQILYRVKSATNAFAVSPDGKWAALACADRTIRLIDLPGGKELRSIAFAANAVAFTPHSQALAAGGVGIRLIDVKTGETTTEFAKGIDDIRSLSFSRDGKLLAVGSPKYGARVLEATTGDERAAFTLPQYGVTAVALSPDGKTLAAGGNVQPVPPPPGVPAQPVFQVWDVASKKRIKEEAWPLTDGSLLFSPAGLPLVTSGTANNGPDIWNIRELRTTEEKESLPDAVHYASHRADLAALAVSADGKLLATACPRGVILLMNLTNGPARDFTRRVGGSVRGLAFTPGAQRLLCVEVTADHQSQLRSFDPAEDRESFLFLPLKKEPIALAVSSQAIICVAEPNGVFGRDPKMKVPVFGLVEKPAAGLSKRGEPAPLDLDAVAFTHDGKTIVTLDRASTMRVWRAESSFGNLVLIRPRTGRFAVALSPDGKTIAVEAGNEVIVLDAAGKERFPLTGHRKAITAIAFSGDGKSIVTAGQDRKVKWWDAASGKLQGEAEHSAQVTVLATRRDGNWIAAGGEDGAVIVWDSARSEFARLVKQEKSIRGLAFSPDGSIIASGSADGSIVIWNRVDKKAHVNIANAYGPSCVAFSNDGKTLLSAGESRMVHFWDAATGQEKSRP